MNIDRCEPLVSIVIPVYNGANYLGRAIDSALGQSYKKIEVIVINDGSTDSGETERIALSYGDKIRYIHKENGGISSALNAGIRAMRGEYFSWLSHDDEYTPEKIAVQVEQLSRYHSGNGKLLAVCNSRPIDKDSNYMSWRERRGNPEPDRVLSWRAALLNIIRYGTYFGCAYLIPKTALIESGLFDEGMRYSQDYYMWLKIFLNGYSLVYSDKVCAYKRRHAEEQSRLIPEVYYHDSRIIGETVLPELIRFSNESENYLYWFAHSNAKYGNEEIAVRCIEEGRRNRLLTKRQILTLKTLMAYGQIRPNIREFYRKVFMKI